jgi:hypothetical protein
MMAALVLAACETNEATDPVEVSAADLAGTYDLVTISGSTTAELDPEYCVDSTLDMDASGDFEIQHHFTARTGVGFDQPCSTAANRFEFDLFWRGEFENTSTLVVMSILESEFFYSDPDTTISEVTSEHTELVGEYNPATERLSVAFPNIWSFNPHGESGGKISIGGGSDVRGLGGGTLIFDR